MTFWGLIAIIATFHVIIAALFYLMVTLGDMWTTKNIIHRILSSLLWPLGLAVVILSTAARRLQ